MIAIFSLQVCLQMLLGRGSKFYNIRYQVYIVAKHRNQLTCEIIESQMIADVGKYCVSTALRALSRKELDFLRRTSRDYIRFNSLHLDTGNLSRQEVVSWRRVGCVRCLNRTETDLTRWYSVKHWTAYLALPCVFFFWFALSSRSLCFHYYHSINNSLSGTGCMDTSQEHSQVSGVRMPIE